MKGAIVQTPGTNCPAPVSANAAEDVAINAIDAANEDLTSLCTIRCSLKLMTEVAGYTARHMTHQGKPDSDGLRDPWRT